MEPTEAFPIGLTGGIGSGKSTVASGFERRGIAIVDSDLLSHALTATGGRAIEPIRQTFGPVAILEDGSLDRARMRTLVFGDPDALRRLEAILHPMIRDETERAVRAARSPYVLVVVPLLFESGRWRERVKRTLVVDCSEEEQIARVMKRSGLSRDEVKAIMARQVDRQTRLSLADDVIDNSGTPELLDERIGILDARYRCLAQAHGS